MKKLLVTAIGSFSAENVIKTCKEAGYTVYGCDIYPAEWVVNSMEVEAFFNVPKATLGQEYLDEVTRICKTCGIEGLLPLTDVEVDLLCSQKQENLPAKLFLSNKKTIHLCRDKYRLASYLKQLKLCITIPGILLSEYQEGMMEYPIIVKPVDGRSSQGLHRVQNADDMEYVKKSCEREAERYLVQPMLTGDVITVDVVRNPSQKRTVCLPRKELLRTLNGAGTSVYVFRDQQLEKQCEAIAEALDIRGCVNMEFVETVSGVYYFLECNPRFAGGVAFSRQAGYDMVRSHLNCFEEKEIEPMDGIKPVYIARRYTEYTMQ